jgi:hypothetical protein
LLSQNDIRGAGFWAQEKGDFKGFKVIFKNDNFVTFSGVGV